ncbi:unnamed protein product [Prorocentrum cordatum]|uniref:Uncharacterized protein n=1 Tax=Prorocentrum cordatum TaxID=2364126 RepID=A0ABN9XQP1_9DINO|nr:unnamed protein product [Polarella glacialis]
MSSSTSHSRASSPPTNEGHGGGESGDRVGGARGDSSDGGFWDSAAWGCTKSATTSTTAGGEKTVAPHVQVQGVPCTGTGDRASECSSGGGGLGAAGSDPRSCCPRRSPAAAHASSASEARQNPRGGTRRAWRATLRRRRALPGTRRWATAATSAACSLSCKEPGAAAPACDRSQASQVSRRLRWARRLAAEAPKAAVSAARVEVGLR